MIILLLDNITSLKDQLRQIDKVIDVLINFQNKIIIFSKKEIQITNRKQI